MKSARQASTWKSYVAPYPTHSRPCVGMCENEAYYSRALDAAYLLMAVMRNTLHDGLLLTFVNTTGDDVDLVWRDYDGDDVNIIKMPPGDTKRFSSITSHNYRCRNTKTGQPYLLNTQQELIGSSLYGLKKHHTIHIRHPRHPLTLGEITRCAVVASLKEANGAFSLPVPHSVQNQLYKEKIESTTKEYYSKNGQPGEYKKPYEGTDEGPLIYPSNLDWSSFEKET